MPNLSTFSMINEKVNKYKDDFALENVGTAFAWLCLEIILDLSADEIEETLTDGPHDGGIDAIYISGKDVHIFSFKYTSTFEHTRNHFPENDLDKLLITMDRVYGKSLTKVDVNDALWEKGNENWDLFNEGPLNFKCYICSNKEKPTEHAQRKFHNHLDRYRFVDYHYLDQEDLATKLLERKFKKVNGTIRFVEKQYFDRSDGSLRGIVATVAATDVIKLVEDPNNPSNINEDVFNDNARIYLKLQNKINTSIHDTALSDENFEFWYLNNGITITCDECSYIPNSRTPTVTLKNMQIVNGGQTTHALFDAYLEDPEKIDNVLLLVRICQTTDYRISEKISETTNRQTPVVSRDLHANDRIQKQLEEELRMLNYFYERKKNQYANEQKSQRLDSELLAQLYLTYYLDMPSEAKNSKVVVFGNKYDDIFNEEITASKMLLPYRIYLPLEERKKEIQRKKRNKTPINEEDAFLSRATFHILNAVKIVAEKEFIDLSRTDGIAEATQKALKYIEDVIKVEEGKRGKLYTHDKFFKEIPTNKLIREHILKQYRSEQAVLERAEMLSLFGTENRES
jgi:hypothetical protein